MSGSAFASPPALLVRMKITSKLRRSRSVSCPYRISSAGQIGQSVSLRRFYASVYDSNFPFPSQSRSPHSLFSWRIPAASFSYFIHAAVNLRPPSVTVSTHTPASNAVAFQSSAMPNAWTSFFTQSTHSYCFPSRLPRTAPSRFLDTIRFGKPPPLTRRIIPVHTKVFSCATLSQSSPTQLSQGHGCTKSSDGLVSCLRCAPIMRSETRWCKVRNLELYFWQRVHVYCIHTVGPRLLRPSPVGSWGRAPLPAGHRAWEGSAWCASSIRGSP